MQKHVLHLPGGQLQYHQFGSGTHLWIAFHGFARDGSSYANLSAYLPDDACLLAFDLPWHGGTDWKRAVFTLEDLVQAIDHVLALKQQTCYTAIGFSFGARLCLALATTEASRWKRLVLLAPDVPYRFWYSFFDRAPLWFKKQGVKLFSFAPSLLKVAKFLNQWNIVDAFSYRFLRLHLQSAASQKRLTGIWLSTATFPTLDKAIKILNTRTQLPIQLITGEQDSVIPPAAFAHLAQQIPYLQWTNISETDHDLLSSTALARWATTIQES
jgi:pimeloyl-ACP methyl ester carboxylesterase